MLFLKNKNLLICIEKDQKDTYFWMPVMNQTLWKVSELLNHTDWVQIPVLPFNS